MNLGGLSIHTHYLHNFPYPPILPMSLTLLKFMAS